MLKEFVYSGSLKIMKRIRNYEFKNVVSIPEVYRQDKLKIWEYLTSKYEINSEMIGVDIGAGNGVLGSLNQNFRMFSSDKFIQTDRSPTSFIQNEAERLPIKSNSIDYVYFLYSLHHFNNKIQALQEAVRVLKLGGYIFIKEEFPRFKGQKTIMTLNDIVANEIMYGSSSNEYKNSISYFDHKEIIKLAKQLELVICEDNAIPIDNPLKKIYKAQKRLLVLRK